MRIYDITLPLEPSLASWPGDTPYDRTINQAIRNGDATNVSALTLSVHTGTHTDAPYHFDEKGATAETVPLATYIGEALVLDMRGVDTIRWEEIAARNLLPSPRLLFRTDAWLDPTRFPDRIPLLAPDVPAILREQGVILVGFDVPSVDELDSKDLPIHHALGAHGIAILENLRLADVPEGRYELIALPLPIVGADGAPVRAILRSP